MSSTTQSTDGDRSEPPVTGTSLADEIAFRAQGAILDGEFPPGTRLQQDDLSARWGVSRTPIREALRILQARGLVRMVPNRGATVTLPARPDVRDAYAVRAQLEGYACELAASHVDGLDVEALNDASRVLTELISKWHVDLGDSPEDVLLYHAMASANNNFHGAVHRAAQNPRLSQLIGELQTVFPKDYVARAIRSQEEASLRYVDEHLAIQQALLDRDGARARRLMVSHIESGCMRLLAYLDDRGFWSHD